MFGSIGVPHGFCFLWNPGLLWLHVLSDSLIALAYFLIPLVLIRIAQMRKDIAFNWIFLCFGAFIIACGATHVLEVVTLWTPIYWVSGAMKAITAVVSLITFVLLVRLSPTIRKLPSHADLEQANRQLNSVLESTSAGVFAVDADWTIRYLNKNGRAMLDPKGTALGRSMFDALPGQQPATIEFLRGVMTSRQPAQMESYYEPLDLSSTVDAFPTDGGGLTVFFIDISEQKRLQRELDLERKLREQRIEALAHMASGLAHEISNPLGIIHARACDLGEAATATPALDSQVVSDACTSIVKTSDRAMRILRGLRMFAREGSKDPLEPALLSTLVQQTVDLVERRFETHGIALTVDLPSPSPTIDCREVQIGQVLLNLLNNAFDAIDAAPGSARWAKITAACGSGQVTIDVTDGGPGVRPENRPHLMKPFFTTKPLGAGIGIGLSLSQAIANDHGGSLALTECAGGHTCFRLTLPLASALAFKEIA